VAEPRGFASRQPSGWRTETARSSRGERSSRCKASRGPFLRGAGAVCCWSRDRMPALRSGPCRPS